MPIATISNGEAGSSVRTKLNDTIAVANAAVQSSTVTQIVVLTQAAYDALGTKVSTTLYVIVG